MEQVYPNYYPRFRCIADRCRHSCCIGWEIDIDDEALAKYRTVGGELGERLKKGIVYEETPHFALTGDERCPFLNERNLCDLIDLGSETLLCQICADHPRFRSFFTGRTEIGLGLCCEEAARLLLTQEEKFTLCKEGKAETLDRDEEALLTLRDELLALAQDRSIPIMQREENILRRVGAVLPERSAREWAAFYLSLERMDETWTALLRDLAETDDAAFSAYMEPREREYEQLLCYFLYRHMPAALDDGDAAGKVAFAVLSTRFLRQLGARQYQKMGRFTPDDQVEYARLYSAEIEYSQENLDALYDELC